jgi:hypothetical protein
MRVADDQAFADVLRHQRKTVMRRNTLRYSALRELSMAGRREQLSLCL